MDENKLGLRLCALKADDAAVLYRTPDEFGAVTACEWDPADAGCLAMVSEAGVLRYWACEEGSKLDLALYHPSVRHRTARVRSGMADPGKEGAAGGGAGVTDAVLYPAGLHLFRFVPNTDRWLVFTMPHVPRVFVTALPPPTGVSSHYAAGSRVYALAEFPHPDGEVDALDERLPTCLAVSDTGGVLGTGDDHGDVHMWTLSYVRDPSIGDVVSLVRDDVMVGPVVKKAVRVNAAHTGAVASIAHVGAAAVRLAVPDAPRVGAFVTAGEKDPFLRLWHATAGSLLTAVPMDCDGVTQLAPFVLKLADGDAFVVAVGTRDGFVSVWDVARKSVVAVASHRSRRTITSLSVADVATADLPPTPPTVPLTGVPVTAVIAVTCGTSLQPVLYAVEQLPGEGDSPRFVLAVKSDAESPVAPGFAAAGSSGNPTQHPPSVPAPPEPRGVAGGAGRPASALEATTDPMPFVATGALQAVREEAAGPPSDTGGELDDSVVGLPATGFPAPPEGKDALDDSMVGLPPPPPDAEDRPPTPAEPPVATTPPMPETGVAVGPSTDMWVDTDSEGSSPRGVGEAKASTPPDAADATPDLPPPRVDVGGDSDGDSFLSDLDELLSAAALPLPAPPAPTPSPVHPAHTLPSERPPPGTVIDHNFRNPARVDAMLSRSVTASIQVGPKHRLYRGGKHDPPVVPVTGMMPHPLVAPTLNSSAWVEEDAARLHAEAFDEEAAYDAVQRKLEEEAAVMGAPPTAQKALNFTTRERVFGELPAVAPAPPPAPRATMRLHPDWARTREYQPDVESLVTLRYCPQVRTLARTHRQAPEAPSWDRLPLRPYQVDAALDDALAGMGVAFADVWTEVVL